MDQIDGLLNSGDLEGTRAALVERVRTSPDDQRARMFLLQVMLVLGEWDKARAQLRTLAQLSPEAQMLAVVYDQTIGAEVKRAKAFAGEIPFPVLVATSPWVEKLARALEITARGDTESGVALRDEAFGEAINVPGKWNGKEFGWVADADPRFGPCFEAIVSGNWGLVPFEAVSALKAGGPKDLRDLVWLPVEMSLRSGQSAAGFIPVRYPGTETNADSRLRLSRLTDWRKTGHGDIGMGQRLYFTDAGDEYDVLSLRSIEMA
ncbi:MAG TPA: type VI secretion system accessory protein TagJ [Micropepsaceae bacterium]|nr:type VI secretion system accessory protein TagJ [Micropepsaceae bacterium]